MPRILVIIPAYNEEASISKTIQDLHDNFPQADYIVINDCSTDQTLHILQSKDYQYLSLPLNLGIGGGVQTGYRYALDNGYDIAIQFDGDGQHRADCIAALIQPIIAGQADMTIGSRFVSGSRENAGFQSSVMRRFGIRFISQLIKLMTGKRIYDVTSGFRAVNRELIEYFSRDYAQDYPEPEAIIAALVQGKRVMEVAVTMNERQGGVSSINALKSVKYMVKVSLAVILSGMRRRKGKGGKRSV